MADLLTTPTKEDTVTRKDFFKPLFPKFIVDNWGVPPNELMYLGNDTLQEMLSEFSIAFDSFLAEQEERLNAKQA